MTPDKPANANEAKSSPQPRRAPPVRLPQATASLVERMLAARCGPAR